MVESAAARRWSKVLDEAGESGLSLRAFARSRRINPSTLAWWKWRLGGRNAAPGRMEATFLEVRVAPTANRGVVLELRQGAARVAIDHETDLGLVRRLLEALS